MLRYAITDVARGIPNADERRKVLQAAARRWAAAGLDYIQLREKSLPATELIGLCEHLVHTLREAGGRTRLLVNGRADIALAGGAHGVHLTAAQGELTPAQVRIVYARNTSRTPLVSISCHTVEQASRAHEAGADLILFGPVFEKVVGGEEVGSGSGLEQLRAAVHAAGTTPVLALGGITTANAPYCIAAGAAGIAGIRLFA